MTSISKNVSIDTLDDMVKEYDHPYHTTIKNKNNSYIDFTKQVNDKDLKFKAGDCVRISNYRNIFAKGYTSSWSEEVCVIKKVKRYSSVDISY